MQKSHLLILFFLLSFFVSCRKEVKKEVLFDVTKSDFEDYITVAGTVDALSSVGVACPRNVDGKIVYLIEDGTRVNAGDTICILEDNNLQTEYDNTLLELENAQANFEKTKANLAMQYAILEAQVHNNKAETQIANLDSTQLQFLSSTQRRIKELELQRIEIERQKLDRKLVALKKIQQSEIRGVEFQIQRYQMRVDQALSMLNNLKITAPSDGLAIRSYSWLSGGKVQEGDQIWGNMPIIQLPNLSKMKVMLQATETQYKRINPEDSVTYTFDAMPNNRAWGKVAKKAPVGQPVKRDSKLKTFEIECTMDSAAILPGPGLSTQCKITLKTLKDTLVIPQVAIFEEDSMKFVFVADKNGFIQKQILTGISNQKLAVVTKGLIVGDKISLIRPDQARITRKQIFKFK